MTDALEGLVDDGGQYEVYAFQYADRRTEANEAYFRNSVYGEGNREFVMGYYFWLIVGEGRNYLVDTGYSEGAASRRGRDFIVTPVEAVRAFGLEPTSIDRVFLSHLHYDHTGNVRGFPNADATLDSLEYDFWTTGHGRKQMLWASAEQDDLNYLEDLRSEGRLELLDGSGLLAPGIKAVRVGGHTPGQQVFTVNTGGAPVVLASDAVHYYDEIVLDRPFALYSDIEGMYDAYELLRRMQGAGAEIIAGHDLEVSRRYGTLADSGLPFVTRIA